MNSNCQKQPVCSDIFACISKAQGCFSAPFGSKPLQCGTGPFNRQTPIKGINVLSLMFEIKDLLEKWPSENSNRTHAIELVKQIEFYLTAEFGSRNFHRREAKRLLSELDSLLDS